MKKIPCLFIIDHAAHCMTRRPNPECDWVFQGEGEAHQKLDGTSCLVKDGNLYKRRMVKPNKPAPAGFVLCGTDPNTGKSFGWVPVTSGPEDKYHWEGYEAYCKYHGCDRAPDGTYELCGIMVNGNPEQVAGHAIINHDTDTIVFEDVPRTYDELKAWLTGRNIEGLVFHHPDGRMAKIRLNDFYLERIQR